ncbi:hypothetical protein FB451DRAFT_1147919, partial [Mycena latifolia]
WILRRITKSFLQTVKFSGTDVAGSHGDLSATCDALAHFSLEDSEEYLVFVDIQACLVRFNGTHVRHLLLIWLFPITHLFDGQDGVTNLGDKGPAGVQDFKLQHKCNSICKANPSTSDRKYISSGNIRTSWHSDTNITINTK